MRSTYRGAVKVFHEVFKIISLPKKLPDHTSFRVHELFCIMLFNVSYYLLMIRQCRPLPIISIEFESKGYIALSLYPKFTWVMSSTYSQETLLYLQLPPILDPWNWVINNTRYDSLYKASLGLRLNKTLQSRD